MCLRFHINHAYCSLLCPVKLSLDDSYSVGTLATLPSSDGCVGRGTSVVGAVDRGCASTTYDIPSSDTYDGGLGPARVLGLI